MQQDPAAIIDQGRMSAAQWGVVATMIALNALDGFDVMSISFAAPGIAAEWGIDRAALGLVLSMELIGMAIGSLLLGQVADRIGRRPTIIACLLLMTGGMLAAATAGSVAALSAVRVVTGLGIGGMLAATNAAVAEAANARHRPLAVVLMAAGYPVGVIIGGSAAAQLLAAFDWRSVFLFGAGWSALMVPATLVLVPESVAFLASRRRPDSLVRINAALARMGHAAITALPPAPPPAARLPLTALFAGPRRAVTLLLTAAYLAHVMTFYFVLKWVPKLVVDMGFPPAAAAGVLVWASIGGASGSVLLGLFTARVRVAPLTIAAMLASTLLVSWFGAGHDGLARLSLVAALAGFATNAGIVGLYALVVQHFRADLRGTATGFIIGVGRGGSALAPALAGLLFAAGQPLQMVAVIMAGGSLIGAAALIRLGHRPLT